LLRADTHFDPERHGFRFVNHFGLSPTLPLLGGRQLRLGQRVIGLCGGMCLGALDYYHAGLPVPDMEHPPDPGTPLYRYLLQRQIDSLAHPAVLMKLARWMLRDDLRLAQLTARNEFPKVQRSLDRGEPVVLLLLREKRLRQIEDNHQVIATGYCYDPVSDHLTLSLYDPNHPLPAQEVEITVTLPDPDVENVLQQSTGERLRGFFVQRYRPRTRSLPL